LEALPSAKNLFPNGERLFSSRKSLFPGCNWDFLLGRGVPLLGKRLLPNRKWQFPLGRAFYLLETGLYLPGRAFAPPEKPVDPGNDTVRGGLDPS
jgi:hypothetical protein